MSWDGYIPNILNNGACQKGGIYGHNGVQWAASEGFEVSPESVVSAVNKLDTNDTSRLNIAGQNYMVVRFSETQSGCPVMYCRLKEHGGFCIVKTAQTVVIGGYDEGKQPGNCNTATEGTADYLKSVSY